MLWQIYCVKTTDDIGVAIVKVRINCLFASKPPPPEIPKLLVVRSVVDEHEQSLFARFSATRAFEVFSDESPEFRPALVCSDQHERHVAVPGSSTTRIKQSPG